MTTIEPNNNSELKICACVFLNTPCAKLKKTNFRNNHQIITLKNFDFDNIDDIDETDEEGHTALMRAIECPIIDNKFDTIELLLANGANINEINYLDEWWNPLMYAINYGNDIEIIKLLLENNAKPNKSTDTSCTALFLAVYNADIELIKLLLDYNADIHHCLMHRDSLLLIALENPKSNNIELISLLLENGVSVDYATMNKNIPLHSAVGEYGNIETVKLLIDYGSKINKLNSQKHTHWISL